MRVRKRVTIFILLSAIIIAYIVRVTVVNKNAERTPVVTYNVGEVVDFGTDYIDTADEAIPGYAIQVLGYELVDTKELYDRYNMGEVEEYALKNTPFIVCSRYVFTITIVIWGNKAVLCLADTVLLVTII